MRGNGRRQAATTCSPSACGVTHHMHLSRFLFCASLRGTWCAAYRPGPVVLQSNPTLGGACAHGQSRRTRRQAGAPDRRPVSRRPRGAPALWRGRGTARRKDGHPSTRPHVHQSTSPAATPRPFSTPWPVRGCPAQRPPPSWCGKVCLGDPSERLTVNIGPGRTAAKRSGSSWPKEYTRAYPHTRSDTHTHKHHTHSRHNEK